MNNIMKRLGNLLSVKSIVTLVLTAVFAYMATVQTISQDFMTIYAVIIAFYFGTQSQKVQDVVEGSQLTEPMYVDQSEDAERRVIGFGGDGQ